MRKTRRAHYAAALVWHATGCLHKKYHLRGSQKEQIEKLVAQVIRETQREGSK